MKPKMINVLSENWTIVDPRDLKRIVRMAQEAEEAGFDMVMISDHIVMGPSAGSAGRMENPRDYAMPGNQDPATPWPSSLILLSAIAAATARIRIGAVALISPLRNPLALASDLATLDLISEGRLVVQPTVSWHKDEYQALGIPFQERGKILNEQLEIFSLLWSGSPSTFHGKYFDFEDVYLEPKAWRPDGPRLWFGGDKFTPVMGERLISYGHGYHPLGVPNPTDIESVKSFWSHSDRGVEPLEIVGGTRVDFPNAHSVASLDKALANIPIHMEMGLTTFAIKPSIFIDDIDEHAEFCKSVIEKVDQNH